MDLVTRVLVEALASLGGEEEILAVPCHPRANTQFRVAIAGRDVNMIDAVFEQDVQHAIRLCLGGAAEGRRTKERDRAQVASTSKRSFLNHGGLLSWVVHSRPCFVPKTLHEPCCCLKVFPRSSPPVEAVVGVFSEQPKRFA